MTHITHHSHKRKSFLKKFLIWTATIIVGIGFLGVISVGALFVYLSSGLPDVEDLENLNAAQSTQIFDRKGNILYTIHGGENREPVEYEEISPYLINATLALEDSEFWEHGGFDIWALGKGVLHEVFGIGAARGGSTITQQYIKNTFLSPEQTYTRKAKELILATRLERAYDKKTILTLYLNRIPYGNNAHGIEKAAEVYFNKDAKDLDLAESALLASIPQRPTRFNPYGENRYSHLLKEFSVEELEKRKITSELDLNVEEYIRGLIGNTITLADGSSFYIPGRSDIALSQMEKLGLITNAERIAALEKIQKIEFQPYREKIKYYHFTMEIKKILEDKYGKDMVEKGGLKVYTTIDPDLQDAAEKIATEKGEENLKKYGANNVAIFTINAKTGEILAMVGSRDYQNAEIDGHVNVVFSKNRQPGSSFKPLVYAKAFLNGYAPGTITYDIPMKIGSKSPANYDNSFRGQMSLRTALGQSRNIPAIQMYYLAGEQQEIIPFVEKLGITTLDPSHSYGYPLSLGAGEVPLYEMVKAYAVFANNGKRPEITGILKIENANGDIIEEWQPKEFEEVLAPEIAYLINSILSDKEVAIGPNLFVPNKITASKTGTSTKQNKGTSGNRVQPSDNWTIGYTPTIVTGVWVGNTDGKGLNLNGEAYYSAAPIWRDVMIAALKNIPAEPFPEPAGIRRVEISKASGKLPGPNTPQNMITTDIFPSFSVPTEKENLFFKVKIDKISGLLATEYTPPEAIEYVTYQNYEPIADLLNWKNELIAYYSKISGENNGVRIGLPPKEYSTVHTPTTAKNKPTIAISSPSTNSSLDYGGFSVSVSINAPQQISRVEYYINNKMQYQTSTAPYTGYLNISKFMKEGSRQLIVAKVIDNLGYSGQSAIEIRVGKDDSSVSSSIIITPPDSSSETTNPPEITPTTSVPPTNSTTPSSTPPSTNTTETPTAPTTTAPIDPTPPPTTVEDSSDSIFNTSN